MIAMVAHVRFKRVSVYPSSSFRSVSSVGIPSLSSSRRKNERCRMWELRDSRRTDGPWRSRAPLRARVVQKQIHPKEKGENLKPERGRGRVASRNKILQSLYYVWRLGNNDGRRLLVLAIQLTDGLQFLAAPPPGRECASIRKGSRRSSVDSLASRPS
jgi:hypothetical protein